MSDMNYLESNIEKLLGAVKLEQTLPNNKKAAILNQLLREASTVSQTTAPRIIPLWLKLAAAAAIIMGVILGWIYLPRPKMPVIGTREIVKQPAQKPLINEPVTENQRAYELKKVHRLFVVKDVSGLVGILEKGPPGMQMAAANYLAQLADESAITPLQKLSQKWDSKNGENPFDAAIQQIQIYQQKQAEIKKMISLRPREYQYPYPYSSSSQGTLCGHITDAKTGEPVVDAKVSLERLYATQTDANGFYIFENIPAVRNYRISIDSNEYVGINDYRSGPSVVIQKDTKTEKDYKLEKAGMIQVQVVDEANQPIEGAELTIMSFDRDVQWKLLSRSRGNILTNKDGTVLIGGLMPSTRGYMIVARHNENIETVNKDGTKTIIKQQDYAPEKLVAVINSTEYIETGRIILNKGQDVTGLAVYEDGEPATDLTISASRFCRYGNTGQNYQHDSSSVDSNGNFMLRHVVPDSYYISANKPAGKEGSVSTASLSVNLPMSDQNMLTIKIPMKADQPLASISGRFTFSNSIPRNVYISASMADGSHSSYLDWQQPAKDICDMNFVLDRLVPGKYKLTFSSSYIRRKTVENIEAPSKDVEVDLHTFDSFLLTGNVVSSETGEPISSFKSRVKQVQSLSPGDKISQPMGYWQTINDKDGRFSLEALGEGIYQVQISANGFAWADSEEIDTRRNTPVVIKMHRGGTIKGIVVNDEGKPIDGAKIMPMSKGTRTSPYSEPLALEQDTIVTVNGVFEINNLTAGRESIKAVHPDYPTSILNDIEVKEGQTTQAVKIVLSKGVSVEGYVYDSAGKPQAGVILVFQKTPGNNPIPEMTEQITAVTTDEKGYYRAEGLPEQICYVSVQKELGVIWRSFLPIRGKVSRYDFGGQPVVKGKVAFNGKSLSDYQIELTTPLKQQSSVFQCIARTGPNGEFTFGGVPKGKWSIYCANPENKTKQLRIATIDTDGSDLDTGVIPKGLSTLNVSIEYEQSMANWDVTDVFLQYEKVIAGSPVVLLDKPASNNEPFITKNIIPGRYLLVVNRGYVTQQRVVDIPEGNVDITMKIPKGTASIQGRLIKQFSDWQIIWRDGKDVVCYIESTPKGSYEFKNIPAGKYHLSPDFSMNSGSLLDFGLAEGEQKVLDIDVSNMRRTQDSVLLVMFLDENGVPVAEADARLESNNSTIEPMLASAAGFYFAADAGTYTLLAKYAGYKDIRQTVTIKKRDEQKTRGQPEPVFIRFEK